MNDFTAALGAALCIGIVTLIVAKISRFLGRFNEETRRIAGKMRRAQDSNEYTYWQSRLRRHYIRLLPFVSEKTAERIYSRLFRKPKHYAVEEPNDGLFHILAPSVLSVCLCAICLCGMSWAWFTVTGSAGVSSIQTASYNVTVTATPQAQISDSSVTSEGRVTTVVFESEGTYKITLAVSDAATVAKGYCNISFDGDSYCTGNFTSGKIELTVYATKNSILTVTSKWGDCNNQASLPDNNTLGTPPAENNTNETTNENSNDSENNAEAVTATETQSAEAAVSDEAVVKDPVKEESAEKTEDATSTENGSETPTVGATTDSTEAVENLGSDE